MRCSDRFMRCFQIAAISLLVLSASASAPAQEAVLSVKVLGPTLAPVETVRSDTNHAKIGGADFLLTLHTSRAEALATCSLRLGFDSRVISFRPGVMQNGLPSGFGTNPGNFVLNTDQAGAGAGAYLEISASGIAGYTGPQTLVLLGFDVLQEQPETVVTLGDNPDSTAPYADSQTLPLPHTNPGLPARFATVSDSPAGITLSLPGDLTASGGQPVMVPVDVDQAAGISALELVLTFDPALLELRGTPRLTPLTESFWMEHRLDEGILFVSMARAQAITQEGSGTLLVLRFDVKTSVNGSVTTPVQITNAQATDGSSTPRMIPVTTVDGRIAIEAEPRIPGDVSGDGRVQVDDAVLVLRHVVQSILLAGADFEAADLNGNEDVGVDDAVMILRKVTEFEADM